MTTFIRGSSITFSAVCTGADGAAFTATKATLTLSYATPGGERVKQDIPCAVVGAIVSATWNSAVASDSMPVHWHIRASSSQEQVAQDGVLRLVAQEANPAA